MMNFLAQENSSYDIAFVQEEKRRRGRPQKAPEELREATNVSLSPLLKTSAKVAAKRRGVSFSELVESCLVRELGGSYRVRPSYYEFFAGGGMARVGLGSDWVCRLANDFSAKKEEAYVANHGRADFVRGCISKLETDQLKGRADLAWASFPCQDLSLAGNRGGLYAERSGAFWPFWELMKKLAEERRAPRSIVMENVPGLLTSRQGLDFADICHELALEGYTIGAIVLDACHFVPQSRKRVFLMAFAPGEGIPGHLVEQEADDFWHPLAMRKSVVRFSALARRHWVWVSPRRPTSRPKQLSDIIESDPVGVRWHTEEETKKLLAMMTPVNRRKINAAKQSRSLIVGALYKRTRPDEQGRKVQRAEVRFDLAGCLRTPGGGSSRQTLVIAQGGRVRTRLISPREAARLMGLPDSYVLPEAYNEAYHLAGDGVVVPAVRFVRDSLLEPVLRSDSHEVARAS